MRFNSDYVVVHPSVLLNLQKSMSHMLTIFSTILRSLIQKTASTVLIKCKKNAFDLIRKRSSDQTTNHPKKSKKRTSHMLGKYFFNVQNKNQNTQQLLLSESSDKKTPNIAAEKKGLKIYTKRQINGCTGLTKKYRKFWNAKADVICKNKK